MPSRLCKQCSKIPFDAELKTLLSLNYDAGPFTWRLGTFGEIRARNCPFCELVASICGRKGSASWDTFTPPDDSEEVVVQWRQNGFSTQFFPAGCYVCISGDLLDKDTYCVRAAFDEFIDFDSVNRWISKCNQEHGGYGGACCPTPFNLAILPRAGKRQLDFRVIDVNTMCIVYAPLRCRYIALSYIWGTRKKSRLVLTSHNEETLMQPGALAKARGSIPNTILDAITVARKLRERYLWVDSLCLVQDDAGELQECVAIMDLFYEMAILTIVTADGEDAWAGLQGVAPTPRRMNRRVRKIAPDLNMTTIMDMDVLLRRSTYSTRAWTMQEEVISPRLLVFIDGQVYYRCAESHYSEALNWPKKPLHDQYSAVGSLQYEIFRSPEASFQDFSIMLTYYLVRKLSFQSDILRAAQGMLRKFSALSGLQCFEGLPPPLDRSLLFGKSSQVFGRREGFPSYSWTGWKSVSDYDYSLETRDGISNDKNIEDKSAEFNSGLRGWIIWHCKLEDGNLCRISDTGRLRKSLLLKPEDSKCKVRRYFQEIAVSVSDVDFGTVRASSYPLLLFWTICINLRLKRAPQVHGSSVGLVNYRAMNKYGESCGLVNMDTTVPEIGEGKFALLAATDDSFWALMLMWEDGVAERRGVAKLSKDVIDGCLPPGPRWKAVVLG